MSGDAMPDSTMPDSAMSGDIDELIALRRDIHRYPEVAFLEIRTAALVLDWLQRLPCTILTGAQAMRADAVAEYPTQEARTAAARRAVEMGVDPGIADMFNNEGTAIIADFTGNRPGPSWALRFDMDGLPVTESENPDHLPASLGFRADNGTMHACGHDSHTAIGLMLARRLADGNFPGRVRLLFQPAEEGARGAAAMIAAGAVQNVDRFLAVHLGNSLPSGTMVGTAIELQATIKFEASFRGVAAHAAGAPQHGRNALGAAATAALQLLALPRSSEGVTNVNVGTLHAGSATNIIPDFAAMTGEVRSNSATVCADLYRGVGRILTASADMYGVSVASGITAESTTLDSDDSLVDEVLEVAAHRFGSDPLRRTAVLSASDDASLFAAEVQRAGGVASYLLVGSGNPAPHHHSRFDIDETSMAVALQWLEDIIRSAENDRAPDVVSGR
jgi:aminobenzoyl-glutamate utilization protein A